MSDERSVREQDGLPHSDIDMHRILTDAEVDAISTALLENGSVEFPVNENIFQVTRLNAPHNKGYIGFSVTVNGIYFETPLLYDTGKKYFAFELPLPIWRELSPELWSGLQVLDRKDPYNLFLWVINRASFPAYLESLKAARIRIAEETLRFRAVLVRKFRQLTYVDEYETIEFGGFLEEARRFAKKRLPPEPNSEWVVREIVRLVAGWAAEEDLRSDDSAKFDPSMSPIDYERFCADRFTAAGWKVRLTKASGDQGVDIICEANGRRLVVQCKLYSGSVGNAAVQEAIAARQFEYADLAAVVSNAPYTTAARELASTARVHLLHHDEICNMKP